MAGTAILLDGSAIETLFRAGGEAAWDLLFKAASRVLVPSDVVRELSDAPPDVRIAFGNWLTTHSGNVSTIVYDYQQVTGQIIQEGKGLGDASVLSLLKQDTAEAVTALKAAVGDISTIGVLTDDAGFLKKVWSGVVNSEFALAPAKIATPYLGTGGFLYQRALAGDITAAQLELFKQNVWSSGRISAIQGGTGGKIGLTTGVARETVQVNLQELFWSTSGNAESELAKVLKVIGKFGGTAGTATVEFALSAAVVGAVAIAKKAGIIGNVLAFGATAAEAEALYTAGDIPGANRLWAKYIFENAGVITGGAVGAALQSKVLQGKGGVWGLVGSILAGGVAGGYLGGDLGGLAYDKAPDLFDPYLNKIYDLYATYKSTMSDPEAFAYAAIKALGFDGTVSKGTDNSDWLIGWSHDQINGEGGNDILIGVNPDYVAAGQPIDPNDPDSGTATQAMRMVLDGGAGDDVVIAKGGTGPIVVGGAGSDLLYNTSYKGQLYGDTIDGTGERSRDVFWWSAGSFIMDAGPEDSLQFFGLPLTGGRGGQARDWGAMGL